MTSKIETFHVIVRPCLVFGLVMAAACGGSEEPPGPRVATRLSVVSGNLQSSPAGTLLPSPIVFEVGDADGRISGASVTFSLTDSTGFLSPRTAVSDSSGRVSTRWTVGGTIGQQTLHATVSGVSPASVMATVSVGPAALLRPVSPPSQFVVVSHDVAAPPSVKVTDRFGNPISGVAVTFADSSGQTTLEGGSQVSDAAGLASSTRWHIPDAAGQFTVRVTAADLTTSFSAFATPAHFETVLGDGQTANAGTLVRDPPVVLATDDSGQPVEGFDVRFAVSAGSGRLTGAGLVGTGPDGKATAPPWIISDVPGENTMQATIAGTPELSIRVTGVVATPATMVAANPTTFDGTFGNYVASRPTVRVLDAANQPVAGADVTFQLVSGGGQLVGPTTKSNFAGEATLGSWRLGPTDAVQTVSAAVGSLAPVVYTVNAAEAPAPAYQIQVRFIGPTPTASRQAAFDSAAAHWSRLVLGDLSDETFNGEDQCGGPPISETVDDLLIFAKIDHIDGPGNVLGQAGICYIRDDNFLSVTGIMHFDVDDVATLEQGGQFGAVVLHEMGHLIGVGSIWELKDLLNGAGSSDPFFLGASARAAMVGIMGPTPIYTGNLVPVENSGGPGTADAHWRESILGHELMTGFLDSGANPLSAITVGSLRDLGYVVDDRGSDSFSLQSALRAATGRQLHLVEGRWNQPIRTRDRSGVVRRIFWPR